MTEEERIEILEAKLKIACDELRAINTSGCYCCSDGAGAALAEIEPKTQTP